MATTLDQLFSKLDELSVAITNEHMRINVQHAEILEAVRSGAPRSVLDELLERVEIAIDRMNTFSLREEEEDAETEPFVFELGGFRVSPGSAVRHGVTPDDAMHIGTAADNDATREALMSYGLPNGSVYQDPPEQHEMEIPMPRAALP